MTIKVGDHIPEATLMHMTDAGPRPLPTDELFKGKKVVLFALPGAFTPTCSNKHLPGFGMGLRAKRFSMLIDDGVVKTINIETAPGEAKESGAETMLTQV